MDNITNNFWDVLLWSFWFFIWIAAITVWFRCIFDLFRDRELSGWGKAGWAVLLILVPWLGALIYLIARGRSMTERQMAEMAQMKAQQDEYIRQAAGSQAAESPAAQIASAKGLLDSGAITQDGVRLSQGQGAGLTWVSRRAAPDRPVRHLRRTEVGGVHPARVAGRRAPRRGLRGGDRVLALAACSTGTALPDARVSVKQQALAKARTEAAAASGALLHHGGRLHHGDRPLRRRADRDRADGRGRQDGGRRPRAAARGRHRGRRGGGRARSRRSPTAEQELAEAQAAAAAREPRSGSRERHDPGIEPSPTTDRAAGDGQPGQAGRDGVHRGPAGHHRPDAAAQASQQFNAAAVALEMSWLPLFADAGCLTDEQQSPPRRRCATTPPRCSSP